MLPPSLGEIARGYLFLLHNSRTIQKDESISVLHDRNCFSTADDGDDCDDGDSSIPPSTATSTPYSPAVNTPTSSPPVYSPPPSTPTSSSSVHTTSPAAQPKVAKPESPETSSAPETSPAPETTHTKAASPSPSPTNTGNDGNGGGDFNFGGVYVLIRPFLRITDCRPSATFFYQKGIAGACGQVHSDDDLIAAMGESLFEANSI